MRARYTLQRRKEQKLALFTGVEHKCLQSTPKLSSKILLESSVKHLVRSIKDGSVTSAEITLNLSHMAHNIGRMECNALSEELYDTALTTAKEIDSETSKSNKMLLGIPISIKDHIDIAGLDSTSGMICRCGFPASKDALIVELLKDAGAVLHAKTTVPQSMMLPETHSAIFGTTRNPWNLDRTPGGSSGGEGALIASRGSLLGIGSDIAGSIRIPCHVCGICGFKPTPMRVSDLGVSLPFRKNRIGQSVIKGTCGPMAHYVDDLALICQAWWVAKHWQRDPYVAPLPFDYEVFGKGHTRAKRRIGWFVTDGWSKASRACVRAVNEAKTAYEKRGFEVKEIFPPDGKDGWEACRLFYSLIAADGSMYSYQKGLEGEPFVYLYEKLRIISAMPDLFRPIIAFILRILGEHRLRWLCRMIRRNGLDVRTYWELVADMNDYKRAWSDLMDQQELDALLCPTSTLPAISHGQSRRLESTFSWTFWVNLLHFPAGVVPITCVEKGEAEYPLEELPPRQRDSIAKAVHASLQGAEGLPVGVQIITRAYTDEWCLHLMKILQEEVGFKAIPEIVRRNMEGL